MYTLKETNEEIKPKANTFSLISDVVVKVSVLSFQLILFSTFLIILKPHIYFYSYSVAILYNSKGVYYAFCE